MEEYKQLKTHFFDFVKWYKDTKINLPDETIQAIHELNTAWENSTVKTACANDFFKMARQHTTINKELYKNTGTPWDIYINKGIEFRLPLMLWFLEKKNTF